MRMLVVAAIGCLGMFAAAPAFADGATGAIGVTPSTQGVQLLSQDHIAKIREEIRIHEGRARELEPIIARDRQARHDVEVNWVVLERHARELHARANDFRAWAAQYTGRDQADINSWATQYDTIATHDEENARVQHEMGDRLDRTVVGESQLRDTHLQQAKALRDWLAAHGV